MAICICPKCGYRNECEELLCIMCDTPLKNPVCEIHLKSFRNPHSVDDYCFGCKFWTSPCRLEKTPVHRGGSLFCIWRREEEGNLQDT